MFLTFLATAAVAVLIVVWRQWPTIPYSLKAVTLSGLEAVMVWLLALTLDLLIQHLGLEEGLLMKVVVYLLAAAGMLVTAMFLMTVWAALLRWHRHRNEGGQHFDFG